MNYLGNDMDRARQIQTELEPLYEKAMQPGLSWREQRALDHQISDLECKLQEILDTGPQAYSAGRYYTSESGLVAPTGRVAADSALVLGAEETERKRKPLPWLLLALGAGTAAYFTLRG